MVPGVVFMALALPFLVSLWVGYLRNKALERGGAQTEGVIVGKTPKNVGEGAMTYLVRVVFQDHHGVDIAKEFSVGRRAQSMLEVGDSLPVVFDTRKPKRARLGPADCLPQALTSDYEKHRKRASWGVIGLFFFAVFVFGVVLLVGALVRTQ